MSVQIIDPGVDPHSKYCGQCSTCGAILEYEYGDLEKPISAWHELHLECPECGRSLAFNPNPITEEIIEFSGSLLCIFPDVIEVPSGIEAYTLAKQGNEIHLNQVTDFIPENTSVLLIGNTATFRHFRGISLPKPISMLQLSKTAIEGAECYYISDSKELIHTTSIPKGQWVISTYDANELTKIVED